MSFVSSEAEATKPGLTRVSWVFLAANVSITIAVCFAGSAEPKLTLALFSLLLLIFLSLWRPELALAAFIYGTAVATHTWTSIGLKGVLQPLEATIILLGLAVYAVRYGFRPRWGPLPALVLLMALLMFLGLIHTPAPDLALKRTAQYLLVNLVVFGVVLFNRDPRVLRRLLWGIVGFGLLIAAASFIDIVFLSGLEKGRYSFANINSIWYSRGLGLTAILLFALASESKRPVRHAVKWLLLPVLFYLQIIAASRGPLLATVVTLSLYLYWVPGKRLRPVRALPAVLFIGSMVLLYLLIPRPESAGRLTVISESARDFSTLYRIQAIFTSVELFLRQPLLGVGTAGFSAFSRLQYPHNIIIEIAAEYGLVGIGLLVTTVVLVVSQCRRLLPRLAQRPRELSTLRGFILITIFAMINAQFSGSITGNSWIWLGLGGIWALGAVVKDQPDPGTTGKGGSA